jgi:hypothetical protein
MNCPTEIAACLLEIVKIGVLNIRTAATNGDMRRCFVEADHIHNLPGLLKSFPPYLLNYYLTVERPSFIHQTPEGGRSVFESVWK